MLMQMEQAENIVTNAITIFLDVSSAHLMVAIAFTLMETT